MTALVVVVVALIAAAIGAAVASWATGRRVALSARDEIERHLADQRGAVASLDGKLAVVQASLDELPLGVVVVDPTMTTILRNRAADNLVGVRHADALVVRALNDHMGTALAGQTRRDVVELFGPPRRTVVVRSSPVEALDSGGATPAAAIVTVEDVSERSRLEAMRTDFVANISHELRTPVGALALLAETLQGERDDATIDRLAKKLEVEAMRVSRTIDDLLELSRIETEGARRARVPVDAIVGEAIDRVKAAAEQRAIAIVRAGPSGLAVAGDAQQLVSALTNLVDNAVKYSEPSSSVTVNAAAEASNVAIVVCDQGIGIPAADLDRVFERFYRVDRARSRITGGTGLGLSIVRHVANNHGGTVSVSSREGVGSTFTLRLPAWDAQASGVVAVEAAS